MKTSQHIESADIAGYCTQLTLWRALAAMSSMSEPVDVTPRRLLIVDDRFEIATDCEAVSPAEAVWSIGATLCYLSSAREPFGGRGRGYQLSHRDAPLPSLRAEHGEELSEIVKRCLNADPQRRPTLNELAGLSRIGLEAASKKLSVRRIDSDRHHTIADPSQTAWPEDIEKM